jgi:hypothetical protein
MSALPPIDESPVPLGDDVPPPLEYWTPARRRWKLPPSLEPAAILVVFFIALWLGPALCRVLILVVSKLHY